MFTIRFLPGYVCIPACHQNVRIHLQPLNIKVIKDILTDYHRFTVDILIDLFIFWGGVPKYIEFFIDSDAQHFNSFIHDFLFENSPLLEEGKFALMEEFRKKYGTYFAILQLISEGKTKRSEIMSILVAKMKTSTWNVSHFHVELEQLPRGTSARSMCNFDKIHVELVQHPCGT